MKYPKFFVSAITVVGISGFSNIAIAQTPPPLASQQSLQEFQQPAQSNFTFGGNGGSGGLNLLQLIQSASLLEGKSSKEVSVGQKETLDEASLQFRKQQRQQLGVTNPILVDGATPNPR